MARDLQMKAEPHLTVDAVSQWLHSPASPPEPEPPSYRMAAEEALRCFEEIAAELDLAGSLHPPARRTRL